MINVVNNHGTGPIQDAINYLKGDIDHAGKERGIKPRDFAGDANDCISVANSIERKHKYISGTLSFRENERPTDKELMTIVNAFRSTFMAGLEHGVNYVDFWNIHEDKGNIELNYIIPTTTLSGKQLNPFPPGRTKEEFKDAFDAYINHKMEYNQVVSDPLKATLSKFEAKVLPHSKSKIAEDFKKIKPVKDDIDKYVSHQILQGKINNRQELCDFLENFGDITRVNDKFISLKIHGSEKAFRLKGPVYEHGADFKQIKHDNVTKTAVSKTKLSDVDFQEVKLKLARLTKSRKDFNTKLISKPSGRMNKNRLYGEKALIANAKKMKSESEIKDTSHNNVKLKSDVISKISSMNDVKTAPVSLPKQSEPVSSVKQKQDAVTATKPQANKNSDGDNSSSSSSNTSTGGGNSDSSIGNLQGQLSNILSQIANEKNPVKANILKIRASEIESKLRAAVEAERINKLKSSGKSSTHRKFK